VVQSLAHAATNFQTSERIDWRHAALLAPGMQQLRVQFVLRVKSSNIQISEECFCTVQYLDVDEGNGGDNRFEDCWEGHHMKI
jgi:hypothetical protein